MRGCDMPIGKTCLPQKITLFHRLGETDGVATYHKTVISGVRLDERLAVSQTAVGERSIETFKAFIDIRNSAAEGGGSVRKYIAAEKFKSLSESERNGYWTVAEGDYLFSGVLTAVDAQKSVTLLKNKMRVFTVNALSVLCDSRGIHHLEVSGRGKLLE